ncbi:molybdenum cofactor guanylyltransferase [Corynebacterium yudongzhengii]|uniref:Molybdenum cofactor guanylyltransferase n=1 Tax=Corynebacterium yudongzhengii TaxID=2080740 RepID=A0A2U1T9F2_9CORY|nr:NTP transferase domain-containing protein [Corynebacterium yudongzhengii]AWB82115.1 molybdenum cofactor guanylyltransferase [Corynebacterium yudongzhengii]PWC02619.1 molybdenum cofactor guanylyltransferase [Corynebacterium yudongzhengii]
MPSLTPGVDVIILAGGRGSRIGGRDKAAVKVDGSRLIDVLLDDLATQPGLMQVAVVTARGLEVRKGVQVVAEDPPFSGPVAAIDAGVRALRAGTPSARTAILAVDAPDSAQLIDVLAAALTGTAEAAVVVAGDGRRQPLCAVWDTAALHRVLESLESVENQPARVLYKEVAVAEVKGDGLERDYDTLAELADYGELED